MITSLYNNDKTDIYIHNEHEVISDVIRQTNNFYEIEFLNYIATNYNK